MTAAGKLTRCVVKPAVDQPLIQLLRAHPWTADDGHRDHEVAVYSQNATGFSDKGDCLGLIKVFKRLQHGENIDGVLVHCGNIGHLAAFRIGGLGKWSVSNLNRPGFDAASLLAKDADHAQQVPRRAA